MPTTTPEQGVPYHGPITDTSRWQPFRHRPDDIFICTPPKCGTTWTQAICAMLVFGTSRHGEQPGMISPWIDAAFAPIEEYLERVERQSHRRFIKTHTPFDGIPWVSECTYLVVLRDPRDAYFSGINHRDNMNDQDLATKVFPTGDDAFHKWLTTVRAPGAWDVVSLESLTHFFGTYWRWRHLPNVHLFHYSDMKRDLRGTIAAMANAVGVTCTDTQLDDFAEHATFDNMQRNALQFAPESGTGMWRTEQGFFATGKSRQWEGRLSANDLAAFDARISELLPPDQVRWLCEGTG